MTTKTFADATQDETPMRLHTKLGVYLLLGVAAIVMLYPLLWMVSGSFKPDSEIFSATSLIPRHLSLASYVRG